MTTETDLLPLPEWTKRDDLGGLVPSEVRVEMQAYARANVARAVAPLQAKIKALRAEVELLNRILGRIVEGDGDSTVAIRMGADAFAAAREYLLRAQEEDHEQ